MDHCDDKGCCELLDEALIDRGRGLYAVWVCGKSVGSPRFYGVAFRKRSIDPGIMINFCPFCGETPGEGYTVKNVGDPNTCITNYTFGHE